MNYLFYLGIIIPTLITIVLFVVFIYCWFLQKARKEVLTKRYDPHGKMRRMGIPMDPPSPPSYCRIGSDFFTDSGEDNEAYDVSRSPSTEQNIRGRPMYRTYHDSGISAGLSPTQDTEPRPGLAYRSCPDSGISGFGIQAVQTSACVHYHACSGCCQDGESIQMHQIQQQQQQQQSSISLSPQNHPQLLNQNQQQMQQQQHPYPQQDRLPQQQQQQQQHHQVILHHNTVPASVHPSHGVCYGDDTTHPQSPQHYNPPPFHQHSHLQGGVEMAGAVGGSTRYHHDVNILPHIQEHPTSCVMQQQQRTNAAGCPHTSPEHLTNIPQATAPPQPCSSSSSSQQHHSQSCCHCQNPPYHHQQLNHENQGNNKTPSQPHFSQPCSSMPPFNQRGDLTNITPQEIQAHYVNREGALPNIDSSSFKPKSFQSKDNKKNSTISPKVEYPPPYQQQNQTTPISLPPYSSVVQHPMHSYRDSGVVELGQPITNTSPSDRPDSQASTSSTTDSEDSGFRSSHTVQHNNNKLNKQGNPLLKPLRRPKNNTKSRSKSGNAADDSQNINPVANGTATPLTTLNPQNLSSQQDERSSDVIQTTSMLDRGDVNISNRRVPPRVLHLNGQNGSPSHSSNKHNLQQISPIRETDWPTTVPAKDTDSKATKQLQQQQQQQQHFDMTMTDISTHLSWKYLQDMSAASSKSASSDGSSSSADDTHRVVSPLLRHAPPEQSMDLFSYSVV